MQDAYVTEMCGLLLAQGWRIERSEVPSAALPSFLDLYPSARSFAAEVRSCVAPGEKVWFLGLSDYLDDSQNGWRFIEQEISIPSTEGDPAWRREVEEFWSRHLPVALHVADFYSYIAVDRQGAFFLGEEPDFESPELVASSPDNFVRRLAREVAEDAGQLRAFIAAASI